MTVERHTLFMLLSKVLYLPSFQTLGTTIAFSLILLNDFVLEEYWHKYFNMGYFFKIYFIPLSQMIFSNNWNENRYVS